MTKSQAESLFRLMTYPEWPVFLQYQRDNLEQLRNELEYETNEIKKLQGQVLEIRRTLKLQSLVNYELDREDI